MNFNLLLLQSFHCPPSINPTILLHVNESQFNQLSLVVINTYRRY